MPSLRATHNAVGKWDQEGSHATTQIFCLRSSDSFKHPVSVTQPFDGHGWFLSFFFRPGTAAAAALQNPWWYTTPNTPQFVLETKQQRQTLQFYRMRQIFFTNFVFWIWSVKRNLWTDGSAILSYGQNETEISDKYGFKKYATIAIWTGPKTHGGATRERGKFDMMKSALANETTPWWWCCSKDKGSPC